LNIYGKWLSDLIPGNTLGKETNISKSINIIEKPSAKMCLDCRGAKLLCGKSRCPIVVNAQSLIKLPSSIDSEIIHGSTPPGIFVGRFGYPQVYIGPLVPPYFGNTEFLDMPETWFGKSIDEIVDYRYSLIRGNIRANVDDAKGGNKIVESLQELSMSSKPVDSELHLHKKPRKTLTLSEDSHPFGPSAPLKSLKSSNVSVDFKIDKVHQDTDLNATEAVNYLYHEGIPVSKIQKTFSVGSLGVRGLRKLVPTRWSITAVDNMISLNLIEKIKNNGIIDEYRVYEFQYLDNIYVAIAMPEPWRFEWIEAWFPQTTWNQYGSNPAMMSDYEEYFGRKTYAGIGGCYYSTRLAAAENLNQNNKQASILLLREIHPGYILPVGVWNVRESIRHMLKTSPQKFDTLQQALKFSMTKLTIPLQKWIEVSALLRSALYQRKITDYKY